MINRSKICVIGDEDLVIGFLLTGIGEHSKSGKKNYMIVNNKTPDKEIQMVLTDFLERTDVSIILLSQLASEACKAIIERQTQVVPVIMELPSKGKCDNYEPKIFQIDNIMKN